MYYIKDMNKKKKLIYGIGVNDIDININVDGRNLLFYDTWHRMLERCYSIKRQVSDPTYKECYVCDEWLLLSNFKKWFDENYVEGFALDKDILVENNKVYSPDACRFVPQYLNNLIVGRNKSNGLPLGVVVNNGSYMARVHDNGCGKVLNKTFKTVEEASTWYSETKKRIVKQQAQRAFLDNAIKTDVYLALVRREF